MRQDSEDEEEYCQEDQGLYGTATDRIAGFFFHWSIVLSIHLAGCPVEGILFPPESGFSSSLLLAGIIPCRKDWH